MYLQSAIDMEMSAHVVFLAGIDHEIPEHVSDDLGMGSGPCP